MADFADYYREIYMRGLGGETPAIPVAIADLERQAVEAMEPRADTRGRLVLPVPRIRDGLGTPAAIPPASIHSQLRYPRSETDRASM